jgi:hypothetical protein
MDLKEQIDLILLDFSKAFDKVPHERLLYKMEYYGIRGHMNPSTLPWGTPDWTGAEVDVAPSNTTCCCLFSRKSLIQLFM